MIFAATVEEFQRENFENSVVDRAAVYAKRQRADSVAGIPQSRIGHRRGAFQDRTPTAHES